MLLAQDTPLWMRQPAISPDGRTIAFCYQGDLYTVPVTGGRATSLTVGGAHNQRPVWSHDGRWLAFASDRSGNFDVYVMPSQGGAARRLTWHSAADLPQAFTPDDKEVVFLSARMQSASSRQFPSRTFAQTWTVGIGGGMARRVHDVPMEGASFAADGSRVLYQDVKGYEDPWRKHHTSAVTRDIWSWEPARDAFRRLTTFEGEDREPVLAADGRSFWYLIERDGTSNVWRATLEAPDRPEQVTTFKRHPVRFLTASREGVLCYAWDGEIYTQAPGAAPAKLAVAIHEDGRASQDRILPVNGAITEFALSPTGKEIAFVSRGEVFVASADGKVTRRVTSTPGQERSVSFSPDGRTLVFAAERGASWDVMTVSLARKEETCFYASTRLEEKPLVATPADEFQPRWSPDGREVAYLEERTCLKVVEVATGKVRTAYPGGRNYSYADGDQDFVWSPDGKWFLLAFNTGLNWIKDVGLLAADGSGRLVNLSRSGFDDGNVRFSPDGSMAVWVGQREGLRHLAASGATADAYGILLTKKAWDRFRLSKEDFALLREQEERERKDREDKDRKDRKDKESNDKDPKAAPAPMAIDWEGLEDRKVRLSTHTSDLDDALVSKEGEKLFELSSFEKGADLWVTDTRTRESKLLVKLGSRRASMELAPDGKALFILSDGRLLKVDADSGKREDLPVASEMVVRPAQERAYIFEHAWRQVLKKFYVADLHGVDWPFYHDAYRRFLPHVADNFDFQDLLGEMLGELNASHTGARYNAAQPNTDATACLGLVLDATVPGPPRVAEVLPQGPVDLAGSRVKPGVLLTAIDGVPLTAGEDPSRLLNRKAGQPTCLGFQGPDGERWEEVVKPITVQQEGELLYRRWVERNRRDTERLSGGRLGYVHVRAMDDASLRTVVDEALGRYLDREALVVDTRFNGGGNIHEQLSDFLSGRKYFDVIPHGQAYGHEPVMKWIKPSVVLVSEGCYSDAHLFPVAYKIKGLGRTVGMPVPGTGTFVWWETQIDPTLVFGIPQGGWKAPDGKFCENNQLEPDLKVPQDPAQLAGGRDEQLEAAVKDLLAGLPRR